MLLCDLNCDMGEGFGNDKAIMPFITSANIACGFHAGNGDLIRQTIDLAQKHQVKIGAHPSFRDKVNFGRTEMQLPPDKVYALVIEQLIRIDIIARERGALLHHVKPHGALYNMAARDAKLAKAIAQAVMDFNEDLVLYGLSGSCLVSEAEALGLKTFNEVFADRSYQDDGSLTPRSAPYALITEDAVCLRQVMKMVRENAVVTVSGNTIPMRAETICIHGDGSKAVAFAKMINLALEQESFAGESV